jgi:hypothetical protein
MEACFRAEWPTEQAIFGNTWLGARYRLSTQTSTENAKPGV